MTVNTGPSPVKLGEQFARDLEALEEKLENLSKSAVRNLERAHKQIGQRWRSEAVKRVPVDTSTLKQRIFTNTYRENNTFITETGSNLKYAVYVEFGTRRIAGGRVLALGFDPGITDAEAITMWPAKAAGLNNADGSANPAVQAAIAARKARGSRDEQMPWLRPAFNSIRNWALKQLLEAVEDARG